MLALALVVSVAGGWAILRAPRAARSAPPPVPASRAVEVESGSTIEARFAPPGGFRRVVVAPGSFAAYLRAARLRPPRAPVRLHTGALKARQDVHAAVLDLDLGPRDLQQCADSVMRLHAEHLFASGRADEIAFHFTSGFLCDFSSWRRGLRPRVSGSEVRWEAGGAIDSSSDSLRRYLDVVFTYAGTRSLPRDLVRAATSSPVEPGDVFLQPGSPGHAMVVVDAAERDGSRAILLAQGYMPAQDVHVVRNPGSPTGGAWFAAGAGRALSTPEWTFRWSERWRFSDP
jgi:hypothetical protein